MLGLWSQVPGSCCCHHWSLLQTAMQAMQLQARGLLLSATQAATGHMAQLSHEAAALCADGWLHAPWAWLAMYAAHNNTWAGLWAGMCCSRLSSTQRHATTAQTGHAHRLSKFMTYIVPRTALEGLQGAADAA